MFHLTMYFALKASLTMAASEAAKNRYLNEKIIFIFRVNISTP